MEMIKNKGFAELSISGMQEIDGGAWWIVVGWICTGVGFGCELTSGIIGICGGNSTVAGAFSIAGMVFGATGTIMTGVKAK